MQVSRVQACKAGELFPYRLCYASSSLCVSFFCTHSGLCRVAETATTTAAKRGLAEAKPNNSEAGSTSCKQTSAKPWRAHPGGVVPVGCGSGSSLPVVHQPLPGHSRHPPPAALKGLCGLPRFPGLGSPPRGPVQTVPGYLGTHLPMGTPPSRSGPP